MQKEIITTAIVVLVVLFLVWKVDFLRKVITGA
jgi:hypothetical protein